jgi:hypothetical protein
VWEHLFVQPAVSPHARLQPALNRGELDLACEAARECDQLDLEDSLRLSLLMKQEHDERFERTAVRWLGKLLSEHPEIGLDLTRQAIAGMRELAGTAPDVGRAELAIVLRRAGAVRAAELLERGQR